MADLTGGRGGGGAVGVGWVLEGIRLSEKDMKIIVGLGRTTGVRL